MEGRGGAGRTEGFWVAGPEGCCWPPALEARPCSVACGVPVLLDTSGAGASASGVSSTTTFCTPPHPDACRVT